MGTEAGSRREDYPAYPEPFAAFVEEKVRTEGVPGLSIAVVKDLMRLYPEVSRGVVMIGNTTGYDHGSILEEAVRLAGSERHRLRG